MELARIMRLKQHGSSKTVTIPAAILKELGWKLGDAILVDILSGSVVLKKLAFRNQGRK
jgi:antitoxin component of MazEF toxin-antitoxin module